MFMDQFIFPDNTALSVLVTGALGFSSLTILKLLTCLHGGIVVMADTRQGSLWPSWLLTYWTMQGSVKKEMKKYKNSTFCRR